MIMLALPQDSFPDKICPSYRIWVSIEAATDTPRDTMVMETQKIVSSVITTHYKSNLLLMTSTFYSLKRQLKMFLFYRAFSGERRLC